MAPSSCHTGLTLSAWPCLVSRTQSHSLREESTKRSPHAHPSHHHSFQVPSFHLVFLSVSVDLFRPCHLVKTVEDKELPQDWGCISSRGPGFAQPFRLVLWPPPQTGGPGGTLHLSSPPMEGVLLSCWWCPCGTLS